MGKEETFQLPIICSVILLVTKAEAILASEHGIAEYYFLTGEFRVIAEIEKDRPEMRSNDGSVDSRGRYWFGTMQKQVSSKMGSIYCVEANGSVKSVMEGVGIPNTMIWLSESELLLADSFDQIIYRCIVDPISCEIIEKDKWINLTGDVATPDGSCLDEGGNVWNAQWDGFRVVKYSPRGEVLTVVELPVQRPTSCAISENGKQLFVTSAREGLSVEELVRFPFSGRVLEIEL